MRVSPRSGPVAGARRSRSCQYKVRDIAIEARLGGPSRSCEPSRRQGRPHALDRCLRPAQAWGHCAVVRRLRPAMGAGRTRPRLWTRVRQLARSDPRNQREQCQPLGSPSEDKLRRTFHVERGSISAFQPPGASGSGPSHAISLVLVPRGTHCSLTCVQRGTKISKLTS